MVIFDGNALGTPSVLWESDFRFTLATEADVGEIRSLVVVAAHPDDETLGAGGLIALAAERQIPVEVIIVTDGAGSHPRSTSITAGQLGALRAEEVRAAVAQLAPAATTTWLGFPDGRTGEFCSEIEARLREEFARIDPTAHVVVVWSGDGHPDHVTVGRIVETVAPVEATVWAYPIWTWHWGHPDTETLPWERAHVVKLSDAVRQLKRSAIAEFVSQIEPLSAEPGDERVLEPELLEHFLRDRELYLDVRAGAER